MKTFFKNLFTVIFSKKVFLPTVLIMLGMSIIDFIGVGVTENLDFGAGFIVTFLYFASWIIYNIRKTKK